MNQMLPCFNDGLFGGNLEIYFKAWDDYGYDFESTRHSDVVPNSWNAWRVQLSTFNASTWHPLTVEVWEDDLGVMGGDDFKGQAVVKGAGNKLSIDIFSEIGGCDGSSPHSIIWAICQIILGE